MKSPRERVERSYLRDVANRRSFDCPAGGRSVRTDAFDAQVGELVKALVLPPDWQSAVLDLVGEQDSRAEAEREQARLRESLRRLRNAYVDGDFTDAGYRRRRDVIGQQLEAVEIPGERDLLQAGSYLESLAEVWTGATLLERREMLRLMLQAAYVDVLEGRLVCIEPKPAFAALFRQVAGLVEREGCFHLAESE